MTRKQFQEERELFRKALIEAMSHKYDQELDRCPEDVACSENHKQKMTAIVHAHAISERRKALKRKLIAAFVASALLVLTACTVYANRVEIKKLFIKVCDSHFQLSYEEAGEAVDKPLTKRYTLGYVPDGYELEYEQKYVFVNRSQWRTSDGRTMSLRQSYWDGANYSIDSESGETTVLTLEKAEIYYRSDDLHTYVWNDGTYSFVLTSSSILSEEELNLILDGIIVSE